MNNYNRELVEERLDAIMENFDFEDVHEVMVQFKWTWASAGGVPTVEQIKDEAAKLLWDLVNATDYDTVATGGFEARKDFSEYDDPFIELKFVLTEWSEGGL